MTGWPGKVRLLTHTVRHLRVGQVTNRISRRLVRPRVDLRAAPPRRAVGDADPGFLNRPVSLFEAWRFEFLNHSRTILPHDFAARRDDLLWDYHFHYFDGLLAEEPDVTAKQAWVESWIDQVTPGLHPAWDPYPVSRRVLNWIKWILACDRATPAILDSLAAQVRYLAGSLEYHLLANHLLANAAALTAAGIFFDGAEGERWRAQGAHLLAAQMDEQFLGDGGHFELSPVYHALILEDLLDLIRIGELCGVPESPGLRSTARRARGWLERMTRPDGRTPLLNDAAYGVSSDPRALIEYADLLGVAAHDRPRPGLDLLRDSGYFRFEAGRLHVIGDVGPPGPTYQPGHAHCDMLSFVLDWAGDPLIVDTGTSTYDAGAIRSAERGTAAHNTVQFGRLEQSEIWASFRMARRGRVDEVEHSEDHVRARITAFPPRWLQHEREWRFADEGVTITDRVAGPGSSEVATARLHFHPGTDLKVDGDGWRASGMRVTFEGAVDVQVRPFEYAPEFNRRIAASALEARFSGSLVTCLSS